MFESRPKKSFAYFIRALTIPFIIWIHISNYYSHRDDVIEGFRLLNELKTPAEIWLVTHPRFPSASSLLRKTVDTCYIKIRLESNFSYSAKFVYGGKYSHLTDQWKLVLSYDPKTKTWECIKNTTLPEHYLPASCHREQAP
jgi:hypothetical protein